MKKKEAIRLMDHQQSALESTEGLTRCAYYHAMGLGKTYTGAEKMFQEGYANNIVICQKSKVEDWIDHFQKHYDMPVYDLSKPKQLDNYITTAKLSNQRIVGVVSYDTTWRRPALLEIDNTCLLLDESSMIANEKSNRSKCILKMGKKAKGVILLSGTPINGGYERLWSQCQLLGWEIKKSAFWNEYIEYHEQSFGGWAKAKIIDGYKNVDELKEQLQIHGARFLKTEDVLTLPEQNDIYITCKAIPQYKELLKISLVTITRLSTGHEEEIFCDTAVSKRLWLRLLCSAYNRHKLERLADLVDSTNENIVIFYNYNDELYAIRKALEGKKIYEVNGAKKESADFTKCDGEAVLLVQYQAGAMGLNLQGNCHIIIYFSYTDRSELYQQSRARISRIGQRNVCYYYHLTVKDSIEEKIYAALLQKKDYTDELFRQDYD